MTCSPGQPLTEQEKLLDEALWYARNGDLDEAAYRIGQASTFDDDPDDEDDEDFGDEDEDEDYE